MWVFWASTPGALIAGVALLVLAAKSKRVAPSAIPLAATYLMYGVSYLLLLLTPVFATPAEWSATMRYVGMIQPWIVLTLVIRLLRHHPPPDDDRVEPAEVIAARVIRNATDPNR